ncbi:lysoplasmalogenase [Nocardioides sp.]|uniref:lysoplasmalogenase n=1 Tax=Nocardioides sp. TaxID=35761 RepID=UPI002EDB50B5
MSQALPRTRRAAGAVFGALALTDAVLAAGPQRWQRARLVTKPLLMPALAASTRGEGRLLGAQAFSWGGDLALLGAGRRPFLAGVGSFFAAHLSYVAAFRARSTQPVLATPGRRRFLAAGAVLASGMALAAAREDRVVAGPVGAYGVALATMVASAAAIDPDHGRDRVLRGAALFLVSDVVLGLRTFVLGEEGAASSALEGVVMATYTAGQWTIAEGLRR